MFAGGRTEKFVNGPHPPDYKGEFRIRHQGSALLYSYNVKLFQLSQQSVAITYNLWNAYEDIYWFF